MNKKDIAHIRKQFKPDNEKIDIREIFNVYVQKESGDIYHHASQPFDMLDKESQELFFANFKKVLSGQLDSRLFELKFQRDIENSSQSILYNGLIADDTEDWKSSMLELVEKMYEENVYEFDTVVTFIYGEYRQPIKKRDPESDEGGNDHVYANRFILCSLNKTNPPKNALVFDYIEKEFKTTADVDPVINLTAPLRGFLFPTFNDHVQDVNHILYRSEKPNQPDESFITNVLNCEEITTAADDKEIFQLLVSKVAGDQVDAGIISNIYEEIDHIVQENADNDEETEEQNLDYQDVGQILKASGIKDVEPEQVKDSLGMIMTDEQYEFKPDNLLPKAIKVNTEVANLTLSPKDLKNMQYITFNGKRCLLIEINEDVEIEGFQLRETNPFL